MNQVTKRCHQAINASNSIGRTLNNYQQPAIRAPSVSIAFDFELSWRFSKYFVLGSILIFLCISRLPGDRASQIACRANREASTV